MIDSFIVFSVSTFIVVIQDVTYSYFRNFIAVGITSFGLGCNSFNSYSKLFLLIIPIPISL